MKVGISWVDITPDKPIDIMGQMHVRKGEYTHDPLTVNAAAFADGDQQLVVVSCDLAFLTTETVKSIQAKCETAFGIPARRVILCCTHTHLAPCTVDYLIGDIDELYMAGVEDSIVRAVGESLKNAEEAALYAGYGWLENMGFNRRGLHHGGERADMYHGSWREGFCGVEGPRDGDVPVIFAKKPNGDIKLVITSFASHPNSVEGECFYSADFVGSLRKFLRENLGEDVGVVYLTGAAGNTAPSLLENNPGNIQPWRGEDGWKRSGLYLGSEVIKTIMATVDPMDSQSLGLWQSVKEIGLRPWPEDLDPETFENEGARLYFTANRNDWPRMLSEENPVEVRLNVIKLGDAVICTNPAEFYVEHGLAIKAASKASVTVISELSDGYVGYVPTQVAFKRGGYSTWPAKTSKLAWDAGDIMVAETKTLLEQAFEQTEVLN